MSGGPSDSSRRGSGQNNQGQTQPRGSKAGQQPQGQTQQYGTGSQPQETGSPTDILSEQSGKRFLKYIVGVFAAVGIGYGVGIVLLDAVSDEGSEFVSALALFVPVLSAPLISMATGLLTGLRLSADERSASLASGVGGFIGFVVLLFILFVFASVAFSGGGGSGGGDGGLGDLLGAMLAFGIGVAITGAGTTFVVKRIGI